MVLTDVFCEQCWSSSITLTEIIAARVQNVLLHIYSTSLHADYLSIEVAHE